MRKLHNKVNIVPLIAKADILTKEELRTMKNRVSVCVCGGVRVCVSVGAYEWVCGGSACECVSVGACVGVLVCGQRR